MPINYKDYPDNWKLLRHKILERANNKCELCFAQNHVYGVRNKIGKFIKLGTNLYVATEKFKTWDNDGQIKAKIIEIVLTIAHIDQDINNNKEYNLLALCQRCHNKLDIPYRIKNRKRNEINKT